MTVILPEVVKQFELNIDLGVEPLDKTELYNKESWTELGEIGELAVYANSGVNMIFNIFTIGFLSGKFHTIMKDNSEWEEEDE